MRLDGGSVRIGLEQGNAGTQPDRGDPIGMEEGHATSPVAATAVTPERPRHDGELGMSARRAEVGEGLLEGGVGAVARIAPHLAIRFFRLLVGGRQQSAIVLLREGLPVEIEGPGLPGLTRAFAASVLVDDDAPEALHVFGNPDGVLHGKDQFAGLR